MLWNYRQNTLKGNLKTYRYSRFSPVWLLRWIYGRMLSQRSCERTQTIVHLEATGTSKAFSTIFTLVLHGRSGRHGRTILGIRGAWTSHGIPALELHVTFGIWYRDNMTSRCSCNRWVGASRIGLWALEIHMGPCRSSDLITRWPPLHCIKRRAFLTRVTML